MFTGIINHIGHFVAYRRSRQEIVIEASSEVLQLNIGDSLAVNGVCLSLIKKEKPQASFSLSRETLQKTNLGACRRGDILNLERPLTLSTPLSGHLVSGHIDRTEKLLRITTRNEETRMTFSLSPDIHPYFVEKGSVAVNGVSLTLAEVKPSSFDVMIIPITLENTNLSTLKRGNSVNVESDMIGKYVYNLLLQKRQK
jgi:riboflavin synthase